VPRPEESLLRAPVLAVPLPWAPGRLCPRLNAYETADSKQNSAAEYDATISHSTRSRGPGTRVGWSPRVVPQTDFARGIAAQWALPPFPYLESCRRSPFRRWRLDRAAHIAARGPRETLPASAAWSTPAWGIPSPRSAP